jgi:hypothetical protein
MHAVPPNGGKLTFTANLKVRPTVSSANFEQWTVDFLRFEVCRLWLAVWRKTSILKSLFWKNIWKQGVIGRHGHIIKISNRRATQRCNVSSFFLCKNVQFTGQKAEQPASTACLLARKCNWLAIGKWRPTCANVTCGRTETSKHPT